MVKKIVAKEKIDSNHLIGSFLDEAHYDILVEEDTDFFTPPNCEITQASNCEKNCSSCPSGIDESRVAFVFRKNYFSKAEQEAAYSGLRNAATVSNNRGMAAGSSRIQEEGSRVFLTEFEEAVLEYFLDPKFSITGESLLSEILQKKSLREKTIANVWLAGKQIENFDSWIEETQKLDIQEQMSRAREVFNTRVSTTTYANPVHSGIAGAFGRVPRIPYGRLTAYNASHPEDFKKSIPFLQTLDKAFKNLLPGKYSAQRKFVDKLDENFRIADTVFTTLTVNKTFRTAAHLDAGDLSEGFSNLLVLSNDGNYSGGYLILPEYKIAINVRPGDLLLVANHTAIHGNTPIVLGSDTSERISIVAYAREDLAELKSFEYENARKKFVETRRQNKEHPLWRERWNGVSPNCFFEDEWKQFLIEELGLEKAHSYEPDLFAVGQNSLEDFF